MKPSFESLSNSMKDANASVRIAGARLDAADMLRELRKFESCEARGRELTIGAAGNFRSLRQRGHRVRKTIDCLTATFAPAKGTSGCTEIATMTISRLFWV